MSHARPIRTGDSGAVQQLQARIAEAGQLQEKMKTANKIVRDRRLPDDEKVARLGTECRIPPDGARQLLKPDFAGRTGFPDYQLTNNGANIRRMQERVGALTKEGTRPSLTVEFPGGRMEDNAEDGRVRIYHDEKPGQDVIGKLKANGFHWSPSNRAWQRLRNDRARWAATGITGVSWPATTAGDSARPAASTTATVRTSPAADAPRLGLSA